MMMMRRTQLAELTEIPDPLAEYREGNRGVGWKGQGIESQRKEKGTEGGEERGGDGI